MLPVLREIELELTFAIDLHMFLLRGYGDLFETLWKVSQDMLDAMKNQFEELLVRLLNGPYCVRFSKDGARVPARFCIEVD